MEQGYARTLQMRRYADLLAERALDDAAPKQDDRRRRRDDDRRDDFEPRRRRRVADGPKSEDVVRDLDDILATLRRRKTPTMISVATRPKTTNTVTAVDATIAVAAVCVSVTAITTSVTSVAAGRSQ